MKISTENLNKIMAVCTKKEIDLIIHIGQYQDNQGVIKGLYYKNILEAINICKSTFYHLLRSLEEKEIIKINYFGDYAYWEVEILNNVFSTQDDYKKGYLKLNYEILHMEEFIAMTKSEKIIVLNLLKINDFRKHVVKLTAKRLMEWTGKSLRSVHKFMDTLRIAFKITKKDNLYTIDCLCGFDTRSISETNILYHHLINYRLHKNKCQSDRRSISDAVTVFKQYKVHYADTVIGLVDRVITAFGEIVPKYLNKITAAQV